MIVFAAETGLPRGGRGWNQTGVHVTAGVG